MDKTIEADPSHTEMDSQRLIHELQVYQIELEMQVEELRQARDEEAMAREMYADLYDFAPVGYVTLDRDGIIRNANLTGSVLLGVVRSQLIGQRLGVFVAVVSRPAFADFLEKVFTSPTKVACEVSLMKEGVPELFVQIEGVAVASGEECRIGLIDITEHKRAEEVLWMAKEATEAAILAKETAKALRLEKEISESLRREKEAAESATRAKDQFLANMSHELRTPMTGVLGMLQLALEEELAPTLRNYLGTAHSSANSLLQILNDILDMTKIEAGKIIIEEMPFSPRRCVTGAVDIITPEVRRKGLDIAISVAEEVPDKLVGDQMRLRQVLINLIANAVKFTNEGKVAVQVTAGGTNSDGKREYTFAVTDTGIGIPEDKKDLLFHVFSQVDASHTRTYGGTGLGLAICKELVELMGGMIDFDSKEGVGSTFYFTISLREAKSERNAPTAAEPLSPETFTAPKGERIPHLLLAEDDPTIQQILEMMLTKSNYSLDIAKDGKQAVEMWEQGEYDLVLMDVQMPLLSGFDVTLAIRERERERGGHTPIVAMTAHTGKEAEKKCIAAGMDHYISKPIDFNECLKLIGQIIGQKSSGNN
ncbi:PAS domain-containing hybrid sensor histidine kinase/response regulator [Pelobacter propionicus]|uniref:PAS domain-containing hybrid sensor histidine kinase/response regulator n=1 Tax=Pelobacter propionicus TaxID=29543 RepID=UPI0018DB97B5|nr:PAS domain-containing hybrid sensor histidine kinase/response regulator [Pelobacter propionicus]